METNNFRQNMLSMVGAKANPKKLVSAYSYSTYDVPKTMYNLQQQFNAVKPTYSIDPATGKTTVTKSMAKPALPANIASNHRYSNYFSAPQQQQIPTSAHELFKARLQGKAPAQTPTNNNLTYTWVLPVGATTGPTFQDTTAPTSDAQRSSQYTYGVTGGPATRRTMNPATYWPDSTFGVPTTSDGEPIFGGTMDYTTGEYTNPEGVAGSRKLASGAYDIGSYDTWGRFNTNRKAALNNLTPYQSSYMTTSGTSRPRQQLNVGMGFTGLNSVAPQNLNSGVAVNQGSYGTRELAGGVPYSSPRANKLSLLAKRTNANYVAGSEQPYYQLMNGRA